MLSKEAIFVLLPDEEERERKVIFETRGPLDCREGLLFWSQTAQTPFLSLS